MGDANFAVDPLADGKRPFLRFDITPSIELKMPLPGGYSWLVTTEVGGYDCIAKYPQFWPDKAHQSSNYFSIDFVPAGAGYPTSVPVLAALGGRVAEIGINSGNGNYIVIDHDGDGLVSSGFQTRYIHLDDVPRKKPVPPATQGVALIAAVNGVGGDTVTQGDQVGILGQSGLSTGYNLHFGVRYQNNGAATVPELARVLMEGKLLKSYQAECSVNSSSVPTDWIRRYPSTNTATGH